MTIKLIKDLNFAQKINAFEAVTESGKECLKNYRSYCFSNAVTCGLVNNFIKEAQNYSYDSGVMSILESINTFVNENVISWKLASTCESLSSNNSKYSFITRTGVEKVEKLLEMNEADIISYIKAGVLKDVQYIPEFRRICKEVYGKQLNEAKSTVAYNMSIPVSYVIVDENKNQIISVNGQTYKITENKIEPINCDDVKFNKINSHLANMKVVDESLVYTYRPAYMANENKFTVTENSIEFTNGKLTENFTDVNAFREFADTFAKAMNINEARQFMTVSTAIAEVAESMNSIVTVDCAKLFNCTNGATIAVIESKDDINVTLFNTYGKVNESKNFKFMNEAVIDMKHNFNIDVQPIYADRIINDVDKGVAVKEAKEEKNLRKLKIEQLSEQFKNDPVKMAVLTEVAKQLKEIED